MDRLEYNNSNSRGNGSVNNCGVGYIEMVVVREGVRSISSHFVRLG